MKVRTPFCYIEVEYLFLIFSFVCVFSEKARAYFSPFFICYLFIVFHELSHVFVASLLGKEIELLKLSLSGMNVKFEREKYKLIDSDSYIYNILIYLAGPLSNIILALIFHNNKLILEINLSLTIINLFPIYPLDGYNILINIFGGKKIYINIIENIAIIILFLVSIYQVVNLKNITILLFSTYIFFIKSEQKKCLKMAKNK